MIWYQSPCHYVPTKANFWRYNHWIIPYANRLPQGPAWNKYSTNISSFSFLLPHKSHLERKPNHSPFGTPVRIQWLRLIFLKLKFSLHSKAPVTRMMMMGMTVMVMTVLVVGVSMCSCTCAQIMRIKLLWSAYPRELPRASKIQNYNMVGASDEPLPLAEWSWFIGTAIFTSTSVHTATHAACLPH